MSAVATLAVVVVDPGPVQGVVLVTIRMALGPDTAQWAAGQGRSAHPDHSLLGFRTV
jgi:hypothetical protein